MRLVRFVTAVVSAILLATVVRVTSSTGAVSGETAKTAGKVVHKGETLRFTGGTCTRQPPSGRYSASTGVVNTANPSKTRVLAITINKPRGGKSYRNPAAVVQWRIGINGLWVFNPGFVKLSRDMKSGTFSGTVTTGLGISAGAGSGSWTCARIK